MLTIPPELAEAMEAGTLARWKQEIAARIVQDFAPSMDRTSLENWVRSAMQTIRRAGATSRSDIQIYANALFRVTEAQDDPIALQDFITIMTMQGNYALRIKTLRKAFPL